MLEAVIQKMKKTQKKIITYNTAKCINVSV